MSSTFRWIISTLMLCLIDEYALILYNISIFQFLCTTSASLLFNDALSFIKELITLFVRSELILWVHNEFCITDHFTMQLEKNRWFISDIGIINDISLQKQVFMHSEIIENINEYEYVKIKLESTNTKKDKLLFYPLQKYIITIPGEASLFFYRLENLTDTTMHLVSVYITTPIDAISYITKLQCFCYEELMLSAYCILDLPILLYVDQNIYNTEYMNITLNYILILKHETN